MPRKHNRLNYRKNLNVYDLKNYQIVELTNHVLQRAKSRRKDLKGLSQDKVKSKLIHEIKYSKIVGIIGVEEHRSFNGHIYVVKRLNGKLLAITYLLSKSKLEERKLNNKCIA